MTTRIAQSRPPGAAPRALGWLFGRPATLQAGLDLAAIAFALATLAQLANPDVLLHCVWVVLAVDAFLFGLRITAIRILLASVFVFVYAALAQGTGTPGSILLADLDLEEWPLMVVIAVVVAVMADRLSATSRRYAALYRQASDRLLTAHEDERRRLARDVHDGVGQTMTALTLTLDAAESMLWAGIDAPSVLTRGAIGRAQELAALALDEARDVARRLRPARIEETGLVAAIAELSRASGVQVSVHTDAALIRPGLLPLSAEVEAFRVVQEALTNSIRHSRARRYWVTARQVGRNLRLEVGDDGIGFDPKAPHPAGLGLAGMAERADAVSGHLTISRRSSHGTIVALQIPLSSVSLAALTAARLPAEGIARVNA
jgi:signal transduction histidine kinase